jgi:3-hydroxybutyryl-CoA dehydrogenase
LLPYIRRNHNLDSYTLDNVSATFVSGPVKGVKQATENTVQFSTKSTKGLVVGRYVTLMDDENDRVLDRALVVAIEDKTVTIRATAAERTEHGATPTRWAQVKDDVSPKDIFRLHRGTAKDRAIVARYCLQDCDLVMEAASENEEVKRKIFTRLSPYLKPGALIATNTSSISITRLASVTDRPELFIGIHFMNPVPRMQLVELIRGIATEDGTFETAKAFVTRLGKTTTVSEDFPAFIVNRILLPMINEAIYTLYEGVGSVEAIDTAMRLGANHPMGPLQLADFIGLDTCLSIMQALHEGLADSKYRPCPLLVKYVEAGWLGRKTRRGFYDYRSGAPIPTR